jgi:putative ABC transport system permease protein
MNAARIVVAQLARRPLQTALAVVLLALGVATLTFVALAHGQLTRQLARDARDIDLVVGAKGSPLQLILSALYHVDVPTGNVPLAAVDQLRANRLVAAVIPVAVGDSHRGFRIVGTEPALLAHYGARFAAGGAWSAPMEAVVGAQVAQVAGLDVGSEFHGTHGLAEGGAVHDDAHYEVVGVLAPSGTVLDRLIVTDKASVWRVHAGDPADAGGRAIEHEREVTALLVRYASPLAAAVVPREVNAESLLMAASPASELARLFAVMGFGIDTMRAFGVVLIASSLLALFVTLYNALEERRYDIAIMRLLGASRARVGALLLFESWLLALAALFAGLAIGLVAVGIVGRWLAESRAFVLSPSVLAPEVPWIAIVAFAAATLAAALPAWRASRMEIAATLARG